MIYPRTLPRSYRLQKAIKGTGHDNTSGKGYMDGVMLFALRTVTDFRKTIHLHSDTPSESQQTFPKASTRNGQQRYGYRPLAHELHAAQAMCSTLAEDAARLFFAWTYLPGHIDGYAEDLF